MDREVFVSVAVEHREQPPAVLVSVGGELDFGTTRKLTSAVEHEVAAGDTLILDLTGLTFCDSSALGAMVAMHKKATTEGGRLYLVGLRPELQSLFALMSLDQLFEIREAASAVYAEIGSA